MACDSPRRHWTGQDSLTSTHNWPRQRGFDAFFGTITGAGSFFDPATLTTGNTSVDAVPEGFYYTDAINDTAAAYIRRHQQADPDQPFFLYVAHTAPHWPLHALPEDIARYDVYEAGWDSLRATRYRRMQALGLFDATWDLTPRDERVPPWANLSDEERTWYQRAMAVYAAQIDRMDQGIGRIIEALEETNLLNNTLIFFLADNGGCAEVLSDNWNGIYIARTTREGGPVLVGNEHRPVLPGPETTYMSYGRGWANASNTPFRLYKHWVHEGNRAMRQGQWKLVAGTTPPGSSTTSAPTAASYTTWPINTPTR